mmetsp:Transcript_29047/g.44326  ORF Transcript_29047/g.44326 Transcript_29047/m.44326 type:complete len:316 (+) Transcript_29047:113-1060(+)
MGQAISKRVMPSLTKAMKSHEKVMAQDAIEDIARKRAQAGSSKYIDPSAMQGYRRDTWSEQELIPRDKEQLDFLKASRSDAPQEMPEDLISFLNEAGPLERKVDKEFTSPKVYDSLLEEEEQRRQQQQADNQRRRRIMPMMEREESGQEGSVDARMDGSTVSRTTNFSTSKKKEETEFTMTDEDLYKLLSDLQSGLVTTDQFLLNKQKKVQNLSAVADEQEKEYVDLIENMQRFNGIPTLMQDTDKSLVGAWSDQVEQLKLLNVRVAPDNVSLSYEIDLSAQTSLKDSEGNEKLSSTKEKPLTTVEFLRQAKSTS